LQDITKIISPHATNSSANMMRSGMASMPKMAREYVQDGMYVAKGKYGKYAKEAALIKEGNDEPLATRALAVYAMQGNNEPLASRATGRVCRAR
jgi:hypothetical protein